MNEKNDLLPIPKYIPYTVEGFERAELFLKLHNVYIPPQADGYYIVNLANNKIRRIRLAFHATDDGVDYNA